QARVHVEWRAGKIDFGIGLREVETGRKLSVLEGKDRLDDTGDGRRGVEVSHIGLYRTDGAVAGALGKGAERLGQGSDLDGIPDWRSRAVGREVDGNSTPPTSTLVALPYGIGWGKDRMTNVEGHC